VLFNAVRAGKFSRQEIEREILPTIAALNGPAMSRALTYELHSCTDITGFGLLGHAMEMAVGSGVRAMIFYKSLLFYDGALAMYRRGQTTGSNGANRTLVARHDLSLRIELSGDEQELLYDPQTSGGLLLALPLAQAEKLVEDLRAGGNSNAALIGEIVAGPAGVTVG
jgi:selenide,water dikinase